MKACYQKDKYKGGDMTEGPPLGNESKENAKRERIKTSGTDCTCWKNDTESTRARNEIERDLFIKRNIGFWWDLPDLYIYHLSLSSSHVEYRT